MSSSEEEVIVIADLVCIMNHLYTLSTDLRCVINRSRRVPTVLGLMTPWG